jgi:signal transduction histidine kinase
MLIAIAGYYEFDIEHPEVKAALAAHARTPIRELGEMLLFGGIPAVVLALVAGWFLMRRAMTPIATLTQEVEHVHASTLNQHLTRSGNRDELDRLTAVFNDMMDRLNDSFSRVREFTLHASHELKTPLTIMRAELESALREGHCDEAQRELLARQLDEIQRLTKIVDSLAFLAKADAGQMAIKSDPVRLDELVRDSFTDAQILAQPGKIVVALDSCEEVVVQGDRHRLRQLLLNLTDNAIKYNQPQGSVTMTLRRNDSTAELRIENTGPGISPERLPRIFDRFFRGDTSHNDTIEGSGLGLSIAQWIVQAHGGSISVSSDPKALTSVKVQMPCRSVA